MRFAPHTDDDVARMLEAIGLPSVDRLFEQIPDAVRLRGELDLPEGVSEMEILADLKAQYVLGFSPSAGGAAGRLRKIQIKVPGRGKVVVRHRAGYRLD